MSFRRQGELVDFQIDSAVEDPVEIRLERGQLRGRQRDSIDLLVVPLTTSTEVLEVWGLLADTVSEDLDSRWLGPTRTFSVMW